MYLKRLLLLKETKKVRRFQQVSKEYLSIYIKTGLNIISLIIIKCKIKKLFDKYRNILRSQTLLRAQVYRNHLDNIISVAKDDQSKTHFEDSEFLNCQNHGN
ncbi:hypothetical protein A3Q56_03717 [Intoshia linei]|uniref:Uncharacterized protein n=1 Tax=Intoshia linei TaxID=1819745 RepID=A0A177B2N8_9BILA|nr:hypothetical protein A3Q56_03717 [Intoshia linei]